MSYKAVDVANFIIDACTRAEEPISNLKLQMLLYFAWVDYYKQSGLYLFDDNMAAWPIGPVVPDVYYEYCAYGGRPINRLFENLPCAYDAILERIIKRYNSVSIKELVDKAHMTDTAWHKVYDNGNGNRRLIPFYLIRKTQRE